MWYNAQGDPAPESIQIVSGTVSWWQSDPASIASWREQHGYIYSERPLPPPPPAPDTTDFDAACAQFRDICYIIRQAIGDPDFRGGFEEMIKLQQAPIYNTIEGLQLANAWSALNDLCTYEGKKIGLGQPEWWHTCWEQEEPQPEDPIESAEPEDDNILNEQNDTSDISTGGEALPIMSEVVEDEPVMDLTDVPDGAVEEPVEEAINAEPVDPEDVAILEPSISPWENQPETSTEEPEDTPANSEPAPPMPEPVAVPEDDAAVTPQEDPIEIPEEPVNTQEEPEETAGQEA